MKKLLFIFFPMLIFSQYDGKVGINTDQPTATLDVAGNARFRNITEVTTTIYLLATDESGNVFKIKASVLGSSCPEFVKAESNPYYLKFRSKNAINYPSNTIVINGLNFSQAGYWIENGFHYYTWTNQSGQPLDINSFSVDFGSENCEY